MFAICAIPTVWSALISIKQRAQFAPLMLPCCRATLSACLRLVVLIMETAMLIIGVFLTTAPPICIFGCLKAQQASPSIYLLLLVLLT
jgi:hypothetical protein